MEVENSVRASSVRDVVQAATVNGGVHFHPNERELPLPRQLPIAPAVLIGREQETDRLTEALSDNGVLVIVGAGGVGKSALALRWAHDNANRFPDGQLYVPLDRASGALSVLQGLLVVLGVAPDRIPLDVDSAAALYRSVLAERRMIVMLDNAVSGDQVRPLLPGAHSCTTLITSRYQLGSLHSTGAVMLPLDVLSPEQAKSFLTRSVAVREADADALDRLVDCCAGLPLALAVVAARAAVHPDFPLALLADELTDESERLNAFDAGDGTPGLRAVLSWSVAALDDDEAEAFRLIGSTPVSEFGVHATASLVGVPDGRAAGLLRRLESKSLLGQHQPGRYRVHDLVHLYAAELADGTDGLGRLLDFYVHTARAADETLFPHRARVPPPDLTDGCAPLTFSSHASALDWFILEHRQLLAVLAEAEKQGWASRVWHLARALDTFHYRHGHAADNLRSSLAGVRAAERITSPLAGVLARRQLGRAWSRVGEQAHATASLLSALELAADDEGERAHTHHDLAAVCSSRGDHESAAEHARSALRAYRVVGNVIGEAHSLNALGREYAELGDLQSARRCCERALELHESRGNASGALSTLDNLGFVAHREGLPAQAVLHYTAALRECRRYGNKSLEAEVVERLGDALLAQGDERAAELFRQARELYRTLRRATDVDRVSGKIDI